MSMPAPQLDLKSLVRDIPDYPKPGIIFKDITPMLLHPEGLKSAIDQLAAAFEGEQIDVVAAAEARGFLVGTPLACLLDVGFAPLRKPGKLPFTTHSAEYELEYGTDTLQVHIDAVQPGQRVLLVDDLLATGGTMAAAATPLHPPPWMTFCVSVYACAWARAKNFASNP